MSGFARNGSAGKGKEVLFNRFIAENHYTTNVNDLNDRPDRLMIIADQEHIQGASGAVAQLVHAAVMLEEKRLFIREIRIQICYMGEKFEKSPNGLISCLGNHFPNCKILTAPKRYSDLNMKSGYKGFPQYTAIDTDYQTRDLYNDSKLRQNDDHLNDEETTYSLIP